LPEILIHNALLILFVDDTSVIVTESNIVDFQFNITVVFDQLNWFNVNLLLINFEKTGAINFKRKKQVRQTVNYNMKINLLLIYPIKFSSIISP
jgi:hypothetical protein